MTENESGDSSSASYKLVYATVIAVLVAIGFVVNIGSIILLSTRKQKTMFHTLLKIMAVYDLLVMLGCMMLYSLPDLSNDFANRVYPQIIPWLVPVVQIAMMTSIYCTILMSFERYIRICHLCQLKSSSILTEDNFWFYVVGFVICPIIFYLPKFFEIRTVEGVHSVNVTVNCSNIRYEVMPETFIQDSEEISVSLKYPGICRKFDFDQDENETFVRVITRHFRTVEIKPTALRENRLYYKLYQMCANTIFASIVPLLSLIYLNICTVLALREMGQSIEECDSTPAIARRSTMIIGNTASDQDPDAIHSTVSESKAEETQRRRSQRPRRDTIVVLSRSFSTRVVRALTRQPSTWSAANGIETRIEENPNIQETAEEGSASKSVSEAQMNEVRSNRQPDSRAMKENKESLTRMLSKKFTRKRRNSDASSAKTTSVTITCGGRVIGHRHATSSSSQLMRRQENRLTRISLSIVSLFIACHVWRLIPTFYEAVHMPTYSEGEDEADPALITPWPNWLVQVNHLSHTLIVFNSAVNFLLYIVW